VKVAVVSPAYAVEVNHDKLRALAALDDIDLTVLAPVAWQTGLGTARAPAMRAPYRMITARVLMNGRVGAFLFRDGLRTLRQARPTLAHLEVEPWSLAALQCVVALRGIPIVLFTWENLRDPRRLLSRVIERLVLRRTAHVIAGNRGAASRMLRCGVAEHDISVLPQFGVDVRRYARGDALSARRQFDLKPPVVGYVGRLVPEKGVERLVLALRDMDARLLIVGDGPVRPQLEALTASWPPGKISFAGAVGPAAVADHLTVLDVLVLPSRTTSSWAEQFGHVLIEAMAAGVPVIGSSSGAIPEVIGDAGLIFSEDDVDALQRQLAWLLSDATLRDTLVERGRQRVRTHYTHDVIAAAQRDIYVRVTTRAAP
jgi:glycosyltransferase involved in cell wall biosynthesis